ncbi:hypothetical protein Goklo_026711 [Gossypium klotzschianum]|uniref:CCHC-type domain-containing protein n=1 Tax=Gossypium klotzschianum TaxID=34286 RepID=A0A7J8TVW4_9ROSI|nr:hypothetical protein [Gossypium klotzschianum]
MVLEKGSTVPNGGSDSNIADEIFSLLEGDVKKSIVNGILAIDFSDRVQKLLVKDMSTSVILKLLGRNIGFTTPQNKDCLVISRKKEILWDIGGMVGKATKLDFNTDSQIRGHYARMSIYINLEKPLISEVIVNGNLQRIEYESLPVVCFSCGRYGHSKDVCLHYQATNNNMGGKDPAIKNPQAASESVVGNDEFGP